MELIKLNLEIPYEKAGAEKPESAAQLVCYLQQPQNMPVPRPAVVICPGGGYRYTSSRESESIACLLYTSSDGGRRCVLCEGSPCTQQKI